MDAVELEGTYGHWGEHPKYSVRDWKAEVANGETRLGYWAWVEASLAIEE